MKDEKDKKYKWINLKVEEDYFNEIRALAKELYLPTVSYVKRVLALAIIQIRKEQGKDSKKT